MGQNMHPDRLVVTLDNLVVKLQKLMKRFNTTPVFFSGWVHKVH